MINYIPLQVKTDFSLLQSTIKPAKLAEYCVKNSIKSVAVTDYGLGHAVQVAKYFKDTETKPIIGTTINLQEKDGAGHITLIAKNLAGWKQLCKINTAALRNSTSDLEALTLDILSSYIGSSSNLICITGGIGSIAANCLLESPKLAYNSQDYDLIKSGIKSGHLNVISSLQNIFKDDFYLDSCIQDYQNRPVQRVLTENWRKTGCKLIATADTHYLEQADCYDQRVLLCSKTGYKFTNLNENIGNYDNGVLSRFFMSDEYDLKTELKWHKPEELKNTFEIDEKCEKYSILSGPQMPQFPCPNGLSSEQYLRQLCREGWSKRIAGKIKQEEVQLYGDRVKYELSVIEEKGFSGYFLILSDIIKWAKSQGQLVGAGRGSAGGCLVSYLSEITAVNPIPHHLLFERFLNPGRKGMPDIDVDFPANFRSSVFDYVRSKYGEINVKQITSFQNIKGRSALKAVLQAYGNTSFSEMNEMTKYIPDEASISDDLQEMKEEEGDSSIIRWVLENEPKKFKDWCEIKPDGSIEGPMATRFEQAIRLENLKSAQAKHPAGVVIAPGEFDDYCPLVKDKHGELIAAMDMRDIEELGLVKLDALSTRILDKIQRTVVSLLD